jgi:hypothetical protein
LELCHQLVVCERFRLSTWLLPQVAAEPIQEPAAVAVLVDT